MADPKGPETGKGATGGSNARPRSPTLDLSATDVTPKDATSEKPEAGKPAAEKPSAATSGASTEAGSKPAAEQKPAAEDKPAAAKPATAAKPASTAEPDPRAKSVDAAAKPVDPAPPKAQAAAAAGASGAQAGAAGASPQSACASQSSTASTKPWASATARPDKPADTAKAAGGEAPKAPASPANAGGTTSAPAQSGGVGFFGMLASALAGAALALLGVALFGKELIGVAQPDMSRVNAVETKISSIGSDVAALRADLAKSKPVDTAAIEAKIGEVSKSVEDAGGRMGGVETEVKALAERLDKPAAPDPAIGVLSGRIDGLELRFQEAPTADQLGVLTSRIAGIEARTKDLPSKDSLADLSVRLDDLGETVDGVGQKIGAATAPLSSKVNEITETLKARPKGDPTARLVVALGALEQALGEGRPFPAEYEAVKAAAGENAELAPLATLAAKGLPTREALGAELAADIAKLPSAKAEPTGSIFDRLAASAGKVVKITPKDAPAGSDPEAIRARVAQLGASGDLEGALAARGTLDEAARAATEEWAALASARVSAEKAIGSARTAALARLTTND